MPKQQRQLLLADLELASLLGQTHISDRNISRVRQLSDSPNPQVALLAAEMLNVVTEAPTLKRKKGRRSIAVTEELCSEICTRWRNAGVLVEDYETGEQMSRAVAGKLRSTD